MSRSISGEAKQHMQTFCVNKEILSEMTEKESSLVNLEQHQMTIKVKAPDMSGHEYSSFMPEAI